IRRETLRPFLWSDSPIEASGITTRQLEGDLPLRFLIECESWGAFTKLRSGFKGGAGKAFALGDPVQQFLLQSGMTLFKGMEFADVRRLQLATEGSTVVVADGSG